MFILGCSFSFSLVFLGSSSIAMIRECSLLSSPAVIKFLQKVDFPLPVSPRTRMFDPEGIPPFKLLSNSAIPVLHDVVSRETFKVFVVDFCFA